MLSDIDQDGMLTKQEYCLAKYLMDYKLHGRDIPKQLPEFLKTPESKELMDNKVDGEMNDDTTDSDVGKQKE